MKTCMCWAVVAMSLNGALAFLPPPAARGNFPAVRKSASVATAAGPLCMQSAGGEGKFMSPEARAQQRLLAGAEADAMRELYRRIEVDAELTSASNREEEDPQKQALGFVGKLVRAAAATGLAFVAISLAGGLVLPQATAVPVDFVLSAAQAASFEKVLGSVPWEKAWASLPAGWDRAVVEKVGLSVLFAPLADRLVVTPILHLYGKFRLSNIK